MLAATSKSTPTLSSSQPILPGPSGPGPGSIIPPPPSRIAPTLSTSGLPPPSAHPPPPLSATHNHDPRTHTHDPRGHHPPPGPSGAGMSAPAPRDPRSQYGNYEQPYFRTPPPHTPQQGPGGGGGGGGGGGFYGGPPPSNVPMGRPASVQGPMQGPNASGGGLGAGAAGASGNPLDAIDPAQRVCRRLLLTVQSSVLTCISFSLQAMLMQVLAMAPEQINMLPQTERDAIMSLVRSPASLEPSSVLIVASNTRQRSQLGGIA